MANMISHMVASQFEVKDVQAFEKELQQYEFEDLQLHNDPGTNHVTMYGADFLSATKVDDEESEMVDIVPMLQKHLAPGKHIFVNAIYQEKYRYLAGESHLITPDQILSVNAETELRKQIKQTMPDVVLNEE